MSDEPFRLLVEGVREYAIFLLDAQGRVATWNVGAERIKGYTAQEVLGRHFSLFYPPEDVAAGKTRRALEIAAETGAFQDEGQRVRKDGSRFWASVAITALRDGAGQVRGFAKVTRDLTEQRKAEDEHRARLAAEEAVRLRDEFLSVAAHELKTPLTSLRGMTQLALRRHATGVELDQERVARAFSVIEAQAQKLSRLVEQLLDVSRIDSGQLALSLERVDVAQLTRSAVETFRERGGEHEIRLDASRPAWAMVDPPRIDQVLANLLENAAKFSPTGTCIDVSVRARRGGMRVAVRDHGMGVAPEERPHLFQRYFRSGAAGHASGMGVGLYVTRQIVEQHGGRVSAEFPADGGTRVVVDLPTNMPADGAQGTATLGAEAPS